MRSIGVLFYLFINNATSHEIAYHENLAAGLLCVKLLL